MVALQESFMAFGRVFTPVMDVTLFLVTLGGYYSTASVKKILLNIIFQHQYFYQRQKKRES